jgi:hypothetical protein
MRKLLAEINGCVSAGAIALLVIGGPGWHRSPKLIIPANISLRMLSPYAPELNAVENVWEFLADNTFVHQAWETYEGILDATWSASTRVADVIRSIGTRNLAGVRIEGRWYYFVAID